VKNFNRKYLDHLTKIVKDGEGLTRQELFDYSTGVLKMTERDVRLMLAVNDLNGKTINGVTMLVD
jgi:hypothetical protein